MPNPRTEFEQAVEQVVGPLKECERAFLDMGPLPSEYERDVSGEDKPLAVQDAADQIRRARDAGLWPGKLQIQTPGDAQEKADKRWDLLRDLVQTAGRTLEPPVVVEGIVRTAALDPGSAVGTGRVRITFDTRLGMHGLFRELRKLWPHLRAAGWVRPVRPLGDKKLALVRHVCLETPLEATMRERMDTWNAKPQLPKKWRYNSLAAFHSDFRRAEVSLTGRRYGLDWFYDTEARWLWEQNDRREILAAVEAGEVSPKAFARYITRLLTGFSAGRDDWTLGQAVARSKQKDWTREQVMERIKQQGGGSDGD